MGGLKRLVLSALVALTPLTAWAGAQMYAPLAASVQAALSEAVSDQGVPYLAFQDVREARAWLDQMSQRLAKRIPNRPVREEFLVTVHYEAKRAGLDPQLVLGLIQVESNFRKYAVSKAGARGYMQVMPFWVKLIGQRTHNLFHLRTNLRYGCMILRHYLDMEHGNLYRALGRYNGSLGQAEYPNLVIRAWQTEWHYPMRDMRKVRDRSS
ncbi:MAG TPA: lytic transglycosylase domain-containing protein [Burkholderiales bacterium]|nr:lytic transglycosylase domain-containing protein [Burkholderiales bacterium]